MRIILWIIIIVGALSTGTTYASVTDVTGGSTIPTGDKFFMDGGSDTYLTSSGNIVRHFSGGVQMMDVRDDFVLMYKSLSMQPNQKFYMDGGGDTFIRGVGNSIKFITGGQPMMDVRDDFVLMHKSVSLNTLKRLYFDGGTNDFITSTGDKVRIFAGGTLTLSVTGGNVGIGTDIPTQKLDVGGNIRLTGNIVSPNDICIGTCP